MKIDKDAPEINFVSRKDTAIEVTSDMTVLEYLIELEKIVGSKDKWIFGIYIQRAAKIEIYLDDLRHYADMLLLEVFSEQDLSNVMKILNMESEELEKLIQAFELAPGTFWSPMEMERFRRTIHENIFTGRTLAHELQHHADRHYMHLQTAAAVTLTVILIAALRIQEYYQSAIVALAVIAGLRLLDKAIYRKRGDVFEVRATAAGHKAAEENKVKAEDIKIYRYLEG